MYNNKKKINDTITTMMMMMMIIIIRMMQTLHFNANPNNTNLTTYIYRTDQYLYW